MLRFRQNLTWQSDEASDVVILREGARVLAKREARRLHLLRRRDDIAARSPILAGNNAQAE